MSGCREGGAPPRGAASGEAPGPGVWGGPAGRRAHGSLSLQLWWLSGLSNTPLGAPGASESWSASWRAGVRERPREGHHIPGGSSQLCGPRRAAPVLNPPDLVTRPLPLGLSGPGGFSLLQGFPPRQPGPGRGPGLMGRGAGEVRGQRSGWRVPASETVIQGRWVGGRGGRPPDRPQQR